MKLAPVSLIVCTDERAIREVIGEWQRATAAGDVDAILRLLSDDVVFLLPGKPPPLAGGKPNVRTGNTLSVFRKQSDGAWVLARDANLLPPL